MADWADQAIDIAKRFGALIIPVWASGLPAVKLNKDKWKDLPDNKLPSDDPSIILKWATAFDAYGVVPSTSFLIIDIDIKDGQHGKESIKFLRDNGLSLETFSVKSPSGGLHFYYNHPTHPYRVSKPVDSSWLCKSSHSCCTCSSSKSARIPAFW